MGLDKRGYGFYDFMEWRSDFLLKSVEIVLYFVFFNFSYIENSRYVREERY